MERVAFLLRIPGTILDALRRGAHSDGRSVNNLIVHILSEWEKQWTKKQTGQ